MLQSCSTRCDPIDGSPPGLPVPGILQARTLEWVAISFSNAWKWKVKGKLLSGVRLLATPWTAAYQAPPFMGFSRQKYWSGVPLLNANKIQLFLNSLNQPTSISHLNHFNSYYGNLLLGFHNNWWWSSPNKVSFCFPLYQTAVALHFSYSLADHWRNLALDTCRWLQIFLSMSKPKSGFPNYYTPNDSLKLFCR